MPERWAVSRAYRAAACKQGTRVRAVGRVGERGEERMPASVFPDRSLTGYPSQKGGRESKQQCNPSIDRDGVRPQHGLPVRRDARGRTAEGSHGRRQ